MTKKTNPISNTCLLLLLLLSACGQINSSPANTPQANNTTDYCGINQGHSKG